MNRIDRSELTRLRADYLDLMCGSLVGTLNRDPALQSHIGGYDAEHRNNGWDWPSGAPSMIGLRRMAHLRNECERVLHENVPGDLLEAGVWRGGACIMMRAVLHAYGVVDRRVFAADTFSGLPQDTDESDTAAFLRNIPDFSIALNEVKAAFDRYHLLDNQVVFIEGAFKHTLFTAPVATLAILRLDGDTYEATKNCLEALYAKVSPRGSVIVDDYFLFEGNRIAVDTFRIEHRIMTPIVRIDDYGGYWIKEAENFQNEMVQYP